CIDCHMPRYEAADVAHSAATNHRILRRPEPAAETAAPERPATPGEHQGLPVKWFQRDSFDPNNPEQARDMGIGLVMLCMQGKIDPVRYNSRALGLLGRALPLTPDDVPGWEAKGFALTLDGQPRQALTAFEAALAKSPYREASLVGAGTLTENFQ